MSKFRITQSSIKAWQWLLISLVFFALYATTKGLLWAIGFDITFLAFLAEGIWELVARHKNTPKSVTKTAKPKDDDKWLIS